MGYVQWSPSPGLTRCLRTTQVPAVPTGLRVDPREAADADLCPDGNDREGADTICVRDARVSLPVGTFENRALPVSDTRDVCFEAIECLEVRQLGCR